MTKIFADRKSKDPIQLKFDNYLRCLLRIRVAQSIICPNIAFYYSKCSAHKKPQVQ